MYIYTYIIHGEPFAFKNSSKSFSFSIFLLNTDYPDIMFLMAKTVVCRCSIKKCSEIQA